VHAILRKRVCQCWKVCTTCSIIRNTHPFSNLAPLRAPCLVVSCFNLTGEPNPTTTAWQAYFDTRSTVTTTSGYSGDVDLAESSDGESDWSARSSSSGGGSAAEGPAGADDYADGAATHTTAAVTASTTTDATTTNTFQVYEKEGGSARGEPTDPVVVMLHGGGLSSLSWAVATREMAKIAGRCHPSAAPPHTRHTTCQAGSMLPVVAHSRASAHVQGWKAARKEKLTLTRFRDEALIARLQVRASSSPLTFANTAAPRWPTGSSWTATRSAKTLLR
jgi:hypothetical protein